MSEAHTKMFAPLRKTGRCSSGNESDAGQLFHAVKGGGWAKALCGTAPGKHGNGWSSHPGNKVTCARCASKLQALLELTEDKPMKEGEL